MMFHFRTMQSNQRLQKYISHVEVRHLNALNHALGSH